MGGISSLIVVRSDGELAVVVARFKQQPGGVRTAHRFVRLGLIDEYVLHVHTVAIGVGKPLFTQQASLELVSARTYDCGVMQLRYQPAPGRPQGRSRLAHSLLRISRPTPGAAREKPGPEGAAPRMP